MQALEVAAVVEALVGRVEAGCQPVAGQAAVVVGRVAVGEPVGHDEVEVLVGDRRRAASAARLRPAPGRPSPRRPAPPRPPRRATLIASQSPSSSSSKRAGYYVRVEDGTSASGRRKVPALTAGADPPRPDLSRRRPRPGAPCVGTVERRDEHRNPREDAKTDFARERRRRALARIAVAAALRARRRSVMLPFEEVVAALGRRSQRDLGVQTIPLDSIVGTVDRQRGEFDRAFRPVRRHPRALGAHRRRPPARRGDAADRRLPHRRALLRPGRPPPRLRRARARGHAHRRARDRGPHRSAPAASCSCATSRSSTTSGSSTSGSRSRRPRARIELSDEWRYAQLATLIEAWGYRAEPARERAARPPRDGARLVPRGVRARPRGRCARPASAARAPRPSATCASRCSASCCSRHTNGPTPWSSSCSARSALRPPRTTRWCIRSSGDALNGPSAPCGARVLRSPREGGYAALDSWTTRGKVAALAVTAEWRMGRE